jgi:hypothetical protein
VDTRNGIVKGKVSRIDPAATGGTVGVDVILDGALPPGARPDLSVDGNIELERLPDVVFMGAPAFGQENSTVSLFKLSTDGSEAERVTVKLGKRSVNQVRSSRASARGSGDPVGHVHAGWIRSHSTQLKESR